MTLEHAIASLLLLTLKSLNLQASPSHDVSCISSRVVYSLPNTSFTMCLPFLPPAPLPPLGLDQPQPILLHPLPIGMISISEDSLGLHAVHEADLDH